jgi:ArsR family transcriptional regulator
MIDSMLTESSLTQAGLLALASDPIRYQLLTTLSQREECVCDLQKEVPVPMNLLSYHLRVLREAGLVTCTPRGRRRDYRLAEGAMERLVAALPGAGRAAGVVLPGGAGAEG